MLPPLATKSKCSEGVGESSQRKKSRAPFILQALKQATGLMSGSSRPSPTRSQGPPSTLLATQAVVAFAIIFYSFGPSSRLIQAIAAPSSTTLVASTPLALLSVGVMIANVLASLPPSSPALQPSAPIILPSTMSSSFSHPSVSLNHVYTSHDTNSI